MCTECISVGGMLHVYRVHQCRGHVACVLGYVQSYSYVYLCGGRVLGASMTMTAGSCYEI